MENNGFTTKQVEDPTLDSSTKSLLTPEKTTEEPAGLPEGGARAFVQANKWYIVAGTLALIVIGVLAFFALRPQTEVREANIGMEIIAPEELPANGESIYKITVRNDDSVTLIGMHLELVYPEGLQFISSTPSSSNLSGNLFAIPNLSPGQNATVLVKLRAQGGIGEEQKLLAKLRYRLDNFNSEFVKTAEYASVVKASNITLNLEGPQTSNNAQLVTYTLRYVNSAEQALAGARIEFVYPSGFVFASATPEPSIGNTVWNVGELNPNTEGVITVNGSYKSAGAGQSQTVSVKLLSPDASGNFRTQAESSFVTQIESLPLLVTHELAQGNRELIADPGETLSYRVKYRNNSNVPARGVNVVVSLSSKAVDSSSIQAEGAQVSAGTITWNAASFSNLEVISPSETGELEFSFRIKDPPINDNTTNVSIVSTAKIKSNEYDTFLPGNELEVKVRSIAALSGTLSFVNGELPPKVGRDTVYTAGLRLTNLSNDFNSCTVTAFLAVSANSFQQGSFSPSGEAAKANFDQSTGKITWNLGTLKAHTGDLSTPKVLSFGVRLNPTASQIGSEVTLVKDIKASCIDTFTGEQIQLTAEAVDTGNISGAGSNNTGRVVQ